MKTARAAARIFLSLNREIVGKKVARARNCSCVEGNDDSSRFTPTEATMYFNRFFRKHSRPNQTSAEKSTPAAPPPRAMIEGLEDRRLLSASALLGAAAASLHGANASSHSSSQQTTVAFSAAPAAVQDGL